jgi:hypothetical protein
LNTNHEQQQQQFAFNHLQLLLLLLKTKNSRWNKKQEWVQDQTCKLRKIGTSVSSILPPTIYRRLTEAAAFKHCLAAEQKQKLQSFGKQQKLPMCNNNNNPARCMHAITDTTIPTGGGLHDQNCQTPAAA